MARYLGPKCKLSRREGTDLLLKSGLKPLSRANWLPSTVQGYLRKSIAPDGVW